MILIKEACETNCWECFERAKLEICILFVFVNYVTSGDTLLGITGFCCQKTKFTFHFHSSRFFLPSRCIDPMSSEHQPRLVEGQKRLWIIKAIFIAPTSNGPYTWWSRHMLMQTRWFCWIGLVWTFKAFATLAFHCDKLRMKLNWFLIS